MAISEANFPDAWFRDYVGEYIDTDKDGYLTDAERLAVTEIDINDCEDDTYYWSINSLAGIEFFPNLQYLYCNCKLSSLDLSQNTKLIEVRVCNDDWSTGMTSLNVTGCTQLESLSCYDQALTSLDLTTNTKLKKLTWTGTSSRPWI